MLHVHIGPSALALGLLVPASVESGFDVAVIGRHGDRSPKGYRIAGADDRDRPVEVAWFEGPEAVEDLPEELFARIRGEEPLLLTCTLRKAIVKRRPFIEALLASRSAEAETAILICENNPHPGYADLPSPGAGVRTLRTVVNRMCVGERRHGGRRRVISSPGRGEWLIERPADPMPLLEQLQEAEEVELVDDIEARYDRKLWMVSGAHQALALVGRGYSRELSIPSSYEGDCTTPPDGAAGSWLKALHEGMDMALRAKHPELAGNLDYAIGHVHAHNQPRGSASWALRGFQRAALAPFVDCLDARIATPARLCHAGGHPTGCFADVFDLFEERVADLDAYADAARLRAGKAEIDEAADARAIESYRRALERWMNEDEVEERVSRVASGLAVCRG